MRKLSIVLIILGMFTMQSFVTCSSSHAKGNKVTHTVLLIHPISVSIGVESREVTGIEARDVSYGNSVLIVYPVSTGMYGEKLAIPYTNIKLIIYGASTILRKGGFSQ